MREVKVYECCDWRGVILPLRFIAGSRGARFRQRERWLHEQQMNGRGVSSLRTGATRELQTTSLPQPDCKTDDINVLHCAPDTPSGSPLAVRERAPSGPDGAAAGAVRRDTAQQQHK
ncbi:hypothetical protein H0E84_05545 [Luteimonas sp. SJ-92]|uniref:Uncharacterized protein n=1 Tax=Luteimonas salinisoli TaxID=2752307 RepID=A0A853JB46_9GAMM|nr:hypothetical protein [Luteimonas salinisoli]NZA25840.1 hypothetical protein [Luteimonas salinisoli]